MTHSFDINAIKLWRSKISADETRLYTVVALGMLGSWAAIVLAVGHVVMR